MSTLRIIDPKTGSMNCRELTEDLPIIIGCLSFKKIIESQNDIIQAAPEKYQRHISAYINQAKDAIDLRNYFRHLKFISRTHCMIFPGRTMKIVDLCSTNGTTIAGLNGGITLTPGEETALKPNDVILLAAGRVIIEYFMNGESGLTNDLISKPGLHEAISHRDILLTSQKGNKGLVLLHDLNDDRGAIQAWEELVTLNPFAKTPNGQLVAEIIKNFKSD